MENLLGALRNQVELFVSSTYFGLVSFILTVVSIALAYIFYKKGKRTVSLVQSLVTFTLIEGGVSQFPKLEILYNKEPLSNFTVSQLRISNKGSVSIKSETVAPSDPIKISSQSGARLLEAEIAYQKNHSNNSRLEISEDGSRLFKFDYMDPGDFCIIKIFHTGTGEESIILSGSIIGQEKPFSQTKRRRNSIGFMVQAFRFAFDPRLHWVRVILNFAVSIVTLAYAFLKNPRTLVWLFLMLVGVTNLYTGIKRVVIRRRFSPQAMDLTLDHMFDVGAHNVTKKLKEAFFDKRKGRG